MGPTPPESGNFRHPGSDLSGRGDSPALGSTLISAGDLLDLSVKEDQGFDKKGLTRFYYPDIRSLATQRDDPQHGKNRWTRETMIDCADPLLIPPALGNANGCKVLTSEF